MASEKAVTIEPSKLPNRSQYAENASTAATAGTGRIRDHHHPNLAIPTIRRSEHLGNLLLPMSKCAVPDGGPGIYF